MDFTVARQLTFELKNKGEHVFAPQSVFVCMYVCTVTSSALPRPAPLCPTLPCPNLSHVATLHHCINITTPHHTITLEVIACKQNTTTLHNPVMKHHIDKTATHHHTAPHPTTHYHTLPHHTLPRHTASHRTNCVTLKHTVRPDRDGEARNKKIVQSKLFFFLFQNSYV